MHKKTLKRSTFNPLTQKVKAPEHSVRLRDYEYTEHESSEHFLPSLQKKKTWRDIDDNVSTWDRNSTTSCMSHSSEIEDLITWKVIQQWEAIENTLYEDGEEVTQTAVLEECIQWRTQIPHLRVIGRNPCLSSGVKSEDLYADYKQIKVNYDSHNEEVFSENNHLIKERKSSSKHKLKKVPQDEILDMLFEHVISELFSNNENELDSFHDDLSEISQINMTPVNSNKSSAKSTKFNWFEETIPLENKFPSSKGKANENRIMPIKKEIVQTNIQAVQKKYENATHNCRIRSGKDIMLATEDKVISSHTSRNKLGTVFNEKIVVSPVPYVLSTKESFSTVKTTPIKFMGQSLEVSTFQGSSRNIPHFKHSGRSSTLAKVSNYQSAWHAPVSPAVWPKNIKLAPLDTSQLISSKNRTLTSSVALQRNRKPLSPISRSTLPVSAQTFHNHNNESLEIQGKRIVAGQSAKLNVSSSGWDYSVGNRSKKKKGQSNKKP